MKIEVVIFDLDDTLYPEITYVKSGFKAVAEFLALHVKAKEDEIFQNMLNILEIQGRGKVFDEILKEYTTPTKRLVQKCLQVYRQHTPNIKLYDEAKELLGSLRVPIYIVTDGNALVQEKKLKALKLTPYIKKAFVTHRYGRTSAKPSPHCFEKIATQEGVNPKNIVYIADNPNKDFVGIKPLGFQTIRLKQGMFSKEIFSKEYEAEKNFSSIQELAQKFDELIKGER